MCVCVCVCCVWAVEDVDADVLREGRHRMVNARQTQTKKNTGFNPQKEFPIVPTNF
jgi:hypothetical protein